jgi:hypothetical protein
LYTRANPLDSTTPVSILVSAIEAHTQANTARTCPPWAESTASRVLHRSARYAASLRTSDSVSFAANRTALLEVRPRRTFERKRAAFLPLSAIDVVENILLVSRSLHVSSHCRHHACTSTHEGRRRRAAAPMSNGALLHMPGKLYTSAAYRHSKHCSS